MKQYLIDGLRPNDQEKLKNYLEEHLGPGELGHIYWMALPEQKLTPIQKEHKGCGPHFFALELDGASLSCELLVRIKTSVQCDCMGYATAEQRAWVMDTVDAMLDELEILI